MRTVVYTIHVPDDYDVEPMCHRIDETLVAIRTGSSETDDRVDPPVLCPELYYTCGVAT